MGNAGPPKIFKESNTAKRARLESDTQQDALAEVHVLHDMDLNLGSGDGEKGTETYSGGSRYAW